MDSVKVGTIQKKVNKIWNIIAEFYDLKSEIKPKLVITNKSRFGTQDRSKCGKSVILAYYPSKLWEEFSTIGRKKKDFRKFLVYAFAESLAMGAQRILMVEKCNKECKNCRGFNKAPKFKLLNYIITYYVADQVVSELFNKAKFGTNEILKKINNKAARTITKALEKVYAKEKSKEFIIEISKKGNKTFQRYFKNNKY